MKRKTIFKEAMTVVLSMVLLFMCATDVSAAMPEAEEVEEEYLIVNGTEVIPVGEDYDNPDTGEYIHWENETIGARAVKADKNFSFKIRFSIKSSKFTVNSAKEKISCSATITDDGLNPQRGYSGHAYAVTMNGKTLKFKVAGTESGTITGLKKGSKYTLQITNTDHLSSGKYLSGSGSVKPVK